MQVSHNCKPKTISVVSQTCYHLATKQESDETRLRDGAVA